jgi:SAM-dependent methyltransferase
MTSLQTQLQSNYASLQSKYKSAATRAATIRRLQTLLTPYLPSGNQTSLDLGAGQGELLEALNNLGFIHADGVEFSPSQVQLAHSFGCMAVRLGEGGEALANQADSSLDLVTCFDVLEHISHDTCAQWFAHISRVLRPGGRLIGHVPNGLSPFSGSIYWGDLTHLWCPVPASIQVFCRSSGLRWLGAYENIGASQGVKGKLRLFSWQVIRSLLAGASSIETGRNNFSIPWSRTFLFVAESPIS